MIRFALTGSQAGSHTYDIPRTRVSFSDRHHCFGSGWPLQVLESRTEPLNPATWLTRDTRVFVCFHISSLSSSTHGQFIDSARINFFKSNCDVFRVSTPSTPCFLENVAMINFCEMNNTNEMIYHRALQPANEHCWIETIHEHWCPLPELKTVDTYLCNDVLCCNTFSFLLSLQ